MAGMVFVPPGLYHDIIFGPNSSVVTCDIKTFNLKDRNSKPPHDETESESKNDIGPRNPIITNLQKEHINYQDPIFGLTFLITTRKDSTNSDEYTLIQINPKNFINGEIPDNITPNQLDSSQRTFNAIKKLFKDNEGKNYPVLYIGIPKPFDVFNLFK